MRDLVPFVQFKECEKHPLDKDVKPNANCALKYFGGWWFDACYAVHLNGKYFPGGRLSMIEDGSVPLSWTGIHWWTTGFNNGTSESLITTEMKVRRNL